MNPSERRREPTYLLGHTAAELSRLDLQGYLYRDTTKRCLEEAGVAPGDSVLDIGSGSGDVSLLCAEMVGASGEVLGYDREPTAVDAARERARSAGVSNVRFSTGPLDTFDAGFDALVGRFILMHQADAADLLQKAASKVRSGGVIAFVESTMLWLLQGPHSHPHSHLYDQVVKWKHAVVESAGADVASGSRLRQVFVAAGLAPPRMRLEAVVAGVERPEAIGYMVESVRSMLNQAEAAGIGSTFGSVDTLETRLNDELHRTGGTITLWPTISAWTRKAASAEAGANA